MEESCRVAKMEASLGTREVERNRLVDLWWPWVEDELK